jgi:hypothetical protein
MFIPPAKIHKKKRKPAFKAKNLQDWLTFLSFEAGFCLFLNLYHAITPSVEFRIFNL